MLNHKSVQVLMKRMAVEQIGRNCYDPSKAKTIGGLEVWPGFYSAMQWFETGPTIQIDLTSKVARKDKVLPFLKEALRKKSPAEVNEEFKGTTVVTSYSKSGKRTYKVERIDFDATPESTFKKKDGSEISYREYFM